MPYGDFDRVAKCLDYRRLGKQRVEVLQIYRALTGQSTSWVNHPATKMWKGYEKCLLLYGIAMCEEWIARGYNDTMLPRFKEAFSHHPEDLLIPRWIYDNGSQIAYRSNLIRKDELFYRQEFGESIPENLEYTWGVIADDG